MRINTNVAAINASNNLSRVQDASASSMAKLSSGLRINSSADDAAGLGIANQFHATTRALTQASSNADQATSLLQIADGATTTIENMLQRMKELATQSASDNTDGPARTRIQSEFSALQSEITRTVTTTKFQGSALLNGSFGSTVTGGTALAAGNSIQTAALNGAAAGTYTLTSAAGTLTMTSGSTTQVLNATDATKNVLNFDKFGITITTDTSYTGGTTGSGTIVVSAGSGGSFMVGSSGSGTNDSISLNNIDLTLATLGISTDNLSTSAGAVTALTHLDTALGVVATAQGSIGASENRISYASDNLKTTIQNFSAAESVIRDVDMATEMTKFSKNQILAQAGTAMLAQANQAGQSVLKLLQ